MASTTNIYFWTAVEIKHSKSKGSENIACAEDTLPNLPLKGNRKGKRGMKAGMEQSFQWHLTGVPVIMAPFSQRC